MEFNTEVRKKQLESLDQYISSSRDKVQSILDCLGWTVEKLLKKDERVPCSVDRNHLIHPKCSLDHVEKCRLIKEGYDLNEQFLSEPLSHSAQSVIKIDHRKKIDILNKARHETPNFKTAWNGKDPDPRTSDRIFSTFSTNERLALYDFAVANTKGPPPLADFNVLNEESRGGSENKVLTPTEIRALERDAKRRQIKYKLVHTNHKTHTEIIKEVIEGQMSLYVDWLNKKHQESAQEVTPYCDDIVDIKKEPLDQFSPQQDFDNTKLTYDPYDEPSRCPSANSKYSNSGSFRDEKRKYRREHRRERRDRSPSEYSNTSSNTSSRKDKEKHSHASHSRHSSIDSIRSMHKRYEEGKYGNGEYKRNHRDYEKYEKLPVQKQSRGYEKYEKLPVQKHSRGYEKYEKFPVHNSIGDHEKYEKFPLHKQSRDYEKYEKFPVHNHSGDYEKYEKFPVHKHSRDYEKYEKHQVHKHSNDFDRKHSHDSGHNHSHEYEKYRRVETSTRHYKSPVEVKEEKDNGHYYQHNHRNSDGCNKRYESAHYFMKSNKHNEYSVDRRARKRSRDRCD